MDIVERLREFESVQDYWGDWEIAKEAADEIERLRKDYALAWENHLLHEQIFVLMEAKVERLREAAKDRPKDRPNDAADEIERLRLREETLSGIIDGMTARFIEAQKAVEEIERLREELEDMHRRERSTAIQQLGNEGQWCDLVAAKDDEIERLRETLKQEQQIDFVLDSRGIAHKDFVIVYKNRAALQQKDDE